MKNLLLIVLISIFIPAFVHAQELRTGTGLPPNPTSGNPDWGTNSLVLNFEPIGPLAGITTANGKIWIVINDTLSTTNAGLILRTSTNNGITWVSHTNYITNRVNIPRLEMTATSNDSVFVWMLFGPQVYRWNVNTNAIKGFDSTTVNDFDIVKSSTNAHYLWISTLSGGLRRFATIDNGYTWQNAGYVQANSINPRMCMSATSDTLFCVYRSPIIAPVQNSIIRLARYRETTPGTLGIIDFKDLTDATVFKNEYNIAVTNSVAWFYYTTGGTGAIDISCRTSIDNGTTFGTAFVVAGNPNTDEYYFDVGISGTGSSRYCDFIYYSDSLQSGNPTNNTDKLMYKYAANITPGTYTGLTQISQFYPAWSPKNFKPIVVELGGVDVGAAWVGGSTLGYKVYWNRYSATGIKKNENEIINDYSLSQNYPNPFNPVTKINFTIPKSGFVTIKVFDILGREIDNLLSENMNPGSYTVDFDGSRLTSGAYFYRIQVNNFTDIKKMMLIK